jgi:diguanylate cyclase (GGDEF)-like protein
MWRSGALVLAIAGIMSLFEALVSAPDRRVSVLVSGAVPALLALIALRVGPRLSPRLSFRVGRIFLVLATIPIAQSEFNWRGTPIAGAMSFHYVLVILFAAAYFNRREVYEELAAIAVASAVGLGAGGVDATAAFTWALTMVGVLGTGLMVTDVVGRMRDLSYGDPLTGAANRRWWEIALHNAITEHVRSAAPLSVVMIDIDRFKLVNDSRGHEAGDQLLVAAVRAWRSVIRTSDELTRIGGDEFAILLPGCDHRAALDVAMALLASLARASDQSCSVGLATLRHGADPAELVSAADRQLYLAKSAGRACVRATIIGESTGLSTGDRAPRVTDESELARARAARQGLRADVSRGA